jgi:hypothetical protein
MRDASSTPLVNGRGRSHGGTRRWFRESPLRGPIPGNERVRVV